MTKNQNNNGWTPERRRKQSQAIKKWKPWEQSTGPRTEAGKRAIRLNAIKHGRYRAMLKHCAKILQLNREFLKHTEMLWQWEAAQDEFRNKLMEKHAKSLNLLEGGGDTPKKFKNKLMDLSDDKTGEDMA